MPFRARVKRAFTRSSTSSGDSALSKPPTNPNVYQPGEKMPPMKYRRPVAPEHKEKLEAFSFARAWRRKSTQSQYSPMGSRMPSRRGSNATAGRKSFQATRLSMQAPRTQSNVDPKNVKEGSDEEGDVANVGLSRHNSHDPAKHRLSSVGRRSQSLRASGSRPPSARRSGSTKAGDAAFSSEDLELALKKSHIDGPPLHAHEEVPTEPPTEAPSPKSGMPALKHDSSQQLS